MNDLIIGLWAHLSRQRKKEFYALIFLMVFASISELISIGAIFPFLAALINPASLTRIEFIGKFLRWLGVEGYSQSIFVFSVLFAAASIFGGFTRLFLLKSITGWSFSVGADISFNIYRKTLYQPYSVHISRNSSKVISGISSETNYVINGVLLPLLNLISSLIILTAVVIVLFMVSPLVASITFSSLALVYLLISTLTKGRLRSDSRDISTSSSAVIKSLQEGLGGIRDVLIDGSQEAYCKIYGDADKKLRAAQGRISFIGLSPRYFVESLGMCVIAVLAYFLAVQPGGVLSSIPILGAIALGAQRMLPVVQQVYGSYTSIKASRFSLIEVLALLDQPEPNISKTVLKDLSFQNLSI